MPANTSTDFENVKKKMGKKGAFKDDWEGLLGNVDTMIYLGGNEQSTHKYVSEMLVKEAINTRSQSITKGSCGSSSISHQQTG